LELYLPFAGAPFPAIDSPYTLQVQHFTISKLQAVIPPLVANDDDNNNNQGNDNQQ
jgi:hypothetical protein